jgi:hypothetical protein
LLLLPPLLLLLLLLLQISGALATVLVGKRKTSPTTETKPGKAPKVGARGRAGCS